MSAVASDARDAAPPVRTMSPKKRLAILGVMLALAFVVAALGRTMRPPPAMPFVGHVPAFAMKDQRGQPFDTMSLAGTPWVADFVFTSCQQTCPRLTARMKEVRDKVAAKRAGRELGVRFVSFSVDPENDTPEVLAAYAAKNGADAANWSFLTGVSDDVQKVVVEGFKITAQRIERNAGEKDILHGNWFVVGDESLNIRGYYNTDTSDDADVIVRDVLRLIAASGK
jgi:protein SCO1